MANVPAIETQEIKAVMVERHQRPDPSVEYPSYGHAMLAMLGLEMSPNTARYIAISRHTASEAALGYFSETLMRIREHGPFMSENDIRRRYTRSLAVAQHFLSIEAKWADIGDDRETKIVHDLFDRFMDIDGHNPTYISATEDAVKALTDNKLAAKYLECMLDGNTFDDHWQPVIDWSALNYVGGVAFIDEQSAHNADIATMKGWSARFAAHPIGDQIENQLALIDEMRELPELFNLPLGPKEHTWGDL